MGPRDPYPYPENAYDVTLSVIYHEFAEANTVSSIPQGSGIRLEVMSRPSVPAPTRTKVQLVRGSGGRDHVWEVVFQTENVSVVGNPPAIVIPTTVTVASGSVFKWRVWNAYKLVTLNPPPPGHGSVATSQPCWDTSPDYVSYKVHGHGQRGVRLQATP